MPSKWTAERRREIEIQCDAVTGRERAALKDCLAEIDRLEKQAEERSKQFSDMFSMHNYYQQVSRSMTKKSADMCAINNRLGHRIHRLRKKVTALQLRHYWFDESAAVIAAQENIE